MWPDGVVVWHLKLSELNITGAKTMADTYTKKKFLKTQLDTFLLKI